MTTIHDPELGERLDGRHIEGWNDTGDAYSLSTGKVILRCLWCDHLVIGDTSAEVVMIYRRDHEKPIFDRLRKRESKTTNGAPVETGAPPRP